MALVCKQTVPIERRRSSAKLVPTFGDRGCRVVSAMDPHGRNFDFLDCSCYCFFQVAPQLSSRLSRPRSTPTAAQKILHRRESNLGPLYL
jgi:hypothetical protein